MNDHHGSINQSNVLDTGQSRETADYTTLLQKMLNHMQGLKTSVCLFNVLATYFLFGTLLHQLVPFDASLLKCSMGKDQSTPAAWIQQFLAVG